MSDNTTNTAKQSDYVSTLLAPTSEAAALAALSNLRAIPNFPAGAHITREAAYGLWNIAESGGWVGWAPSLALQCDIRSAALQLAEVAPGDDGVNHRRFLLDAHLRLALECAGVDSLKAEVVSHLSRAADIASGLAALFESQEQGDERAKTRVAEMRFRMLMSKSEAYYELQRKAEALVVAMEARALLSTLPDSSNDLGVFAYNCGVKDHHAKDMDSAISWLQLSAAAFDRLQSPKSLCRSLRLLAGASLQKGDIDSAKKAASLAVEIDGSALSLVMMARTHLSAANETSQLENALTRLLQASDLSLRSALDLCREMRMRNQLQLGLWVLKQVQERFAADPAISAATLEHLLLLQASEGGASSQQSLKMVEVTVANHLSGSSRLSSSIVGEIVRVCFDTGTRVYRDGKQSDAITWIHAALSLLPAQSSEDATVRSQIHRVLCSIYLDMDDVVSATRHAQLAASINPSTAPPHYMVARCAIKTDDVNAALNALQAMGKCKDFVPDLVWNIACQAQEVGKALVVVKALEMYLEALNGSDPDQVTSIVSAARALVRSLSNLVDYPHVARILQLVIRRAEQAGGWCVLYAAHGAESEWMCKASFNAAVAALANKDFGTATALFDMCTDLCSWDSKMAEIGLQARLRAVQCFLDHRSHDSALVPQDSLNRLKEHMEVLRGSTASNPTLTNDLDLLEFRLALLKGDAISSVDLCSIIQSLASLNPNARPNLFERIASASLASKRRDAGAVAAKALSVSFRLHGLQKPSVDVERCSIVARNLIALSVHQEEQQQLSQLKDVIDLAKSEPSWPLHERQWIAMHIWNAGASSWRQGKLHNAEKFCSLALTFSRCCGSHWPQAAAMRAAYETLLSKIHCETSTTE